MTARECLNLGPFLTISIPQKSFAHPLRANHQVSRQWHLHKATQPQIQISGALRTLRTECFPRPNEDEYLVSPLSSASTAGTYMSSTGQGQIFRPSASSSMSDLHRTVRNDYSITRSSSLSDASAHPSPYAGYGMHNRFAGQANQPGLPYMRRPMEYAVPRHPGGMGYDQHQSFEGSVSPTDSQSAHMNYEMNTLGLFSQHDTVQPGTIV